MIIGSRKGWQNLRQKTLGKRSKAKMTEYGDRDTLLASFGFASYQEYLQSESWKYIRRLQMSSHPNCISCGLPATEVHHVSYNRNTMLGIGKVDVVSLCRKCHCCIEFVDGGKVSLPEANERLLTLCGKADAKGLLSGQLKIKRNNNGFSQTPSKSSPSRRVQTKEAINTAKRIVGLFFDMGGHLGRATYKTAVSRIADAIDRHDS